MSEWVVVATYPNPWQGNREGTRADQMIRDRLIENYIHTAVRGMDTVVMIVPEPQAKLARALIAEIIVANQLRAETVDSALKYPDDYGTNNPIFWSMK